MAMIPASTTPFVKLACLRMLLIRLKLAASGSSQIIEIRSPIPGRIRSAAQAGANVASGAEIAVIDPASEQVWEALRALYVIGQPDDLPAVLPYQRDLPNISNDIRQQAVETEKAIRSRAVPAQP